MEKHQKITLETATSYHLSLDELRKMYTLMALSKYNYMRKPNYNEEELLKLLRSDIKELLVESQSLTKQIPNNHSLHKIMLFFDNHNKYLKMIDNQ